MFNRSFFFNADNLGQIIQLIRDKNTEILNMSFHKCQFKLFKNKRPFIVNYSNLYNHCMFMWKHINIGTTPIEWITTFPLNLIQNWSDISFPSNVCHICGVPFYINTSKCTDWLLSNCATAIDVKVMKSNPFYFSG